MARKRRQLVIMSGAGPAMGTLREVRAGLARFNTSPDGSGSTDSGIERLHGPGMVVEVSTSADPVSQAVATLNDEDYAFPVLMKLCRAQGWKMVDIETGRTFGG